MNPFFPGTEGAMRELQHKKSDRSGSKKQIQVKFEVQIYKVRDGEYCIDIQVYLHLVKSKAIFNSYNQLLCKPKASLPKFTIYARHWAFGRLLNYSDIF